MVLFLGMIARKLMDGDNNNQRPRPRPAAYPVVGVPVASMPCNCRGDRYCDQCSPHHHHSQQQMAVMPVMAPPMISPYDSRREWKYERRAMRDARRAARRGYGYDYGYAVPAAVPVAAPPMNNGYARGGYYDHDDDYRAAGPSSRSRPQQRSANYWEDEDFTAPPSSSKGQGRRENRKDRRLSVDEEHFDEEQGEDLPPKYEPGDWETRTRSAEASTHGKRHY
ncbi:hypothetical protein VP1G_08680 [Cytospora mali]|uniref:Uncharacterized protein n=1 Tax=Cytospora mali TaxID=578113 RepID=A0A194VBX4_CYTMA|nr:hypothetical protein VP1G_08680 [Valsa mali var. pyri (nom. inval.)]